VNRRSLLSVVPVAVLAIALALAAAPAGARVAHPFVESLDGTATPAASFTPSGVAVDPSSHDLYVSDSAHKLIDKFSSTGTYLCQITGLGESSASLSECDKSAPGPGAFSSGSGQGIVGAGGEFAFPDLSAHAIDRFAVSGAFIAPQLAVPASGNPSQVALDASGNLYVTDTKNLRIDKYTIGTATWSTFASGTPAGHFGSPSPAGVAVDTDPASPAFGDVYVGDPKRGAVDVFTSGGAFAEEINATPQGLLSNSLGKLATDPTDGHLFVPDTGNRTLDEFAPGGAFLDQTAIPSLPTSSSPQGVAVDPVSGKLYVADPANERVDVFSTVTVPNVTTEAATAVEEIAANLNGTVDPDGGGEVTECEFEYVETAAYEPSASNPYAAGERSSCSPTPPYGSPATVSAQVSLAPHTTYHYRLVAANANGIKGPGEDQTFTTLGTPVVEADSEQATVSGVNATLKAEIDPFGLDTTCQVQFITEPNFQSSGWAGAVTAPCSSAELGPAFGNQSVLARLEGLKVGTTYHYRFLAANSAGQTEGSDGTFITFGIHEVEFEIFNGEGPGHPYTQAGGHPTELVTNFGINWTENFGAPLQNSDRPNEIPTGNLRNVVAELPPGLVGNPAATPRCTRTDVIRFKCAGADQVGQLEVKEAASGDLTGYQKGLYNVVPPKGVVAEFGANLEQHVTVFIDFVLRPDGNYAVTSESLNNSDVIGVSGVSVDIWGVPADPVHDFLRQCPNPTELGSFGPCSANQPQPKPLLTDPTSCGGALRTVLGADSYQAPGLFDRHAIETEPITGCNQLEFSPTLEARPTTNRADSPTGLSVDLHVPQQEGCEVALGSEGRLEELQKAERLIQEKREEIKRLAEEHKSSKEIEAVDEELTEAQEEFKRLGVEPFYSCAIATANLKDTTVTLPQGLAVNPAAAAGLKACSSSQIGLTSAPGQTPIRFSGSPAQCPDASKIGTVELLTPVIAEEDQNHNPTGEHPLPGAVYIAAPHDNPFGSLLALYITVEDPRYGIVVKLAGHVEADPQTGQLTASFDENPQLPFEDFKLKFFGGAHSTLRTPSTCGNYKVTSVLTPWSAPETGPPATPSDPWQITQPAAGGACPSTAAEEANNPSFEAGTEAPVAGAYSPFILHLSRADGTQELKGIDTALPPGLTGKLAGVAECSEAQIAVAHSREHEGGGSEELASPSCPAASQLGTVNVGAGSGPAPYYVQGSAYLAGPYKGAPLSLAIITPAVAGPFDLGTVVVRAALDVNPETAQITAKSDPIPTILQGIPLDVRSIALKMTRNQFTLNPTSCEKKQVTGIATSVLGQPAALSNPFQVGGCKALSFSPKLKISLKGGTRRNANPALKAVVVEGVAGEANVARASVALPHSEFLDQAHIGTVCTRVQFAAGAVPGEECPAGSIYGFAKAVTPLLDKPLEGPVYLRSSSNTLPDLVASLRGQVDVVLDGRVDTDKAAGIRTTFESVPDAAISTFTLEMKGGKKGLLVNSENICKKPQRATAKILAQNGKNANQSPLITNSCKGGGKKGDGKHHKTSKRQTDRTRLSRLLGGS
jgi:DNA-binding beta-propeller fold protein YncE